MGAFTYGFDDSGGESYGDGLTDGEVSVTASPLDDPLADITTDDTLTGSSLPLDTTDGITGAGVTDSLSLLDDFNLSGASDPAPSGEFDTGIADNNGAGSAASTHLLSAQSHDSVSQFMSAVGKFGSNIGALFARGAASNAPVLNGAPRGVNPNRSLTTSITAGHAALIVGLVIVIGGAIALGGKK